MFDCLKSFYFNLLASHLDVLRKRFVTKVMYIDESLYFIDGEGGWINPPRLYSLMKKASSTRVFRRPVYGVMYIDRALGRMIRLLSIKHNILSLDLTLLRRKGGDGELGRYADVIQMSRSLLDEYGFDCVDSYGVGVVDSVDVLVADDGPIIVVTDEETIAALAGYLYISRILLALLGEWVLFNPVKYLGGSDVSTIRAVPVDEGLNDVSEFSRLYGYVVECGGSKYLELI